MTTITFANDFERGSWVTLQAVMAWLDASDLSVVAEALSKASERNDLERFRPVPVYPQAVAVGGSPIADPIKPTDLAPPKLTRDQATGAGFTGNTCATCGSMMMVRNGTCEKCASCGTTTGCS